MRIKSGNSFSNAAARFRLCDPIIAGGTRLFRVPSTVKLAAEIQQMLYLCYLWRRGAKCLSEHSIKRNARPTELNHFRRNAPLSLSRSARPHTLSSVIIRIIHDENGASAAYALVCKANDAMSSLFTSRSSSSRERFRRLYSLTSRRLIYTAFTAFRTPAEVIMYHIKK